MRYEFILWYSHFLKFIPGRIGCKLRNLFIPYKNGRAVKVWDQVHIDSPSKLSIGNNVSINRGCILNAGGRINIGDDVLIGPNVVIYSQNHNFRDRTKPVRLQGYTCKEVNISNNVWIAANCIILPGVTIGANVVIAAGSIIRKDIESNCIVYGDKIEKRLD